MLKFSTAFIMCRQFLRNKCYKYEIFFADVMTFTLNLNFRCFIRLTALIKEEQLLLFKVFN